jgi:hypothetical protein
MMARLIAEHLIRTWCQRDHLRYGVARLDIVRVDELDQSVLDHAVRFRVIWQRFRRGCLHEQQLVNKALSIRSSP